MKNIYGRLLINSLFYLFTISLFQMPLLAQSIRDVAPFPVGSLYSFSDATKSGDPTKYFSVMNREFNQATIEALDWYSSHAAGPGIYNFKSADSIITICETNGQRIHGDHLVWYSFANSYVSWLKNYTGTDSAFNAIVKDHVTTIVSRYRGRVASYNAINEPFEGNGSLRKTNKFYEKMGSGYIDSTFKWARAADPNVTLFLNDFDLSIKPQKLDSLITYVNEMKARGVSIDGVGTQMHINVDDSKKGIDEMFRKMASTGLKVMITELDISFFFTRDIIPNYVPSAADKKRQADMYRYVVESYCKNVPAAQRYALTMWGFTDKVSWIRGYVGKYDYPCLFDDDMNAKDPQYIEFVKGLRFFVNKELPGRFQAENATITGGVVSSGTDEDQTGQVVIAAGKSIAFPVQVTKTGLYPLKLRVKGSNAIFTMAIDGGNAVRFKLPNTTGYYTFPQTEAIQFFATPLLSAGSHTVTITGVSGSFDLNWIESNSNTINLPTKIQAEDYNLQKGLVPTTTGVDDDATLAITQSDSNDFVNYTVAVPTDGNYILNFRVANSATTYGAIEIRKNAITQLATLNVEPTGGDNFYTTQPVNVRLNAGLQTLQLVFKHKNLSLNWINVKDYIDVQGNIEAEFYTAQTDTQLINTNSVLRSVQTTAGSNLTYKVYTGIGKKCFVSVRATGTGTMQIKAGGSVATVDVTNSAAWDNYNATLDVPSGIYDVELSTITGNVAVDWVTITPYVSIPGVVQAEDFSDAKGIRTISTGKGTELTATLAYLQPQDYVDYLIDVKQAGSYLFTYRAKGYVPVSTIELQYGDTSRVDTVLFKNYAYTDVPFLIDLPAGVQTLRLTFPTGDVNLDYFEIDETKYYTSLKGKLQTEKQLTGGTYIIGGLTENAVLVTRTAYGSTNTLNTVAGEIFTKSITINNPVSQFSYNAGLTFTAPQAVAANDVLLAVFYARCTTCNTDGKARISYQIQHSGTSSTYFGKFNQNVLTSQWQLFYMPFEALAAQQINQLKLSFLLGYPNQTVELAGFAMINYKKGYTLAQLQNAINTGTPSGRLAATVLTDEVLAYPNPATEEFTIPYKLKQRAVLQLYNSTGMVVLRQEWLNTGTEKHTIKVRGLPTGMYVFRINEGGKVMSSKVIIE